jgi:Arc/MetJ-type ribon-helix-helix transcriptional regulator
MQRTQIYLSEHDLALLDREVERTGRTRSRLIRDAIDRMYSDQVDADEFERVLRAAAGAWKNRPFTGAEFVDAVRGRRPGGLAALWPEGYGPDADPG